MRFRYGCCVVSPQRRVGMVSKASRMAHRRRGAVSGGAFGMFFPAHRFRSTVFGASFLGDRFWVPSFGRGFQRHRLLGRLGSAASTNLPASRNRMVGIDEFLLISCISQLTDFNGTELMAGKLTSGEKRQKLARAAMNVIWRDGYHAATIQAVADEAGLPAGGVFYRFPKKHDLAQAALETMENEFTPLLASIAPNGTVRQRLSIFFDYLDAMTPRRVSHGCPLARLMLDLPADGAFDPARQTGQAVFDGLIHWVAGQLARAGLADERARTEGRRMILRWQGAIILAHSMADRAILDDEIRDLRDTANRLIDGA